MISYLIMYLFKTSFSKVNNIKKVKVLIDDPAKEISDIMETIGQRISDLPHHLLNQ